MRRKEQNTEPHQEGKQIPLHRRFWNLRSVRYFRGFISNLMAMAALCLIYVLFLIDTGEIKVEQGLETFEAGAVQALEFVFPEYFVTLGDIKIDIDPSKKGWLVFDEIFLQDAVDERLIAISQVRISPSIMRMLFGNTRFYHIVVDKAEIDYKLEPPKQDAELGFPIAGLDIPAQILTQYGDIEIRDMVLRLVSSDDNVLFSLRDMQAGLENDPNGYKARIGARQTESQEGSFVFNITRNEKTLTTNGFARNYLLSGDEGLSLDFDMKLDFQGVPSYDFTEIEDNIAAPYQYLNNGNGLLRLKGEGVSAEAHYDFDPEKSALAIKDMRLDWGEQRFQGNVDVYLGDEILAKGYEFGAQYEGRQGAVDFEGGSFVARINLTQQSIDLGEISFFNEFFHLHGHGRASLQPDLALQLDGQLDGLSHADVERLWPADLGDAGYEYMIEKFGFATIDDIAFWLRFRDEFDMEITGLGKKVDIEATSFLPNITSDEAMIRVGKDSLLIVANHADFKGYEEAMDFADIGFWIPAFGPRPIKSFYEFSAKGDVSALLGSLDKEPISVAKRTNIEKETVEGSFFADFDIQIPFKSDLKFSDINLLAEGELNNVKIPNLASGQDLSAPKSTIRMTQNQLKIAGPASFGALDGSFEYSQNMAAGSPANISVNAVATPATLRGFGVSLPSAISLTRVPMNVDVSISKGAMNFDANADIREVSLAAAPIGQIKSKGQAGRLNARGRFASGKLDLEHFEADAGNVVLRGRAPSNGPIYLSRAYVKDLYDGEVIIDGNTFTLRNGTVDLESFEAGEPTGDTIHLIVENINAHLLNRYSSLNTNGELWVGDQIRGYFSGLIGGKAPARTDIWQEGRSLHVNLKSNDFGLFLRSIGLFQDVNGGLLDLHVKTTGYKGIYAGKFDVSNFSVNNSSTAIKLLQVASIFGGLEGNSISFDNLNADLVVTPDRYGLYSGYLYGPSIGITLGGSYYPKSQSADFFGVLTPAYLLNGAFQRIPGFGQLLGGNEGEGLFGVTYRINGQSPNLNVQANPLALLTPGATRNIWGNVPQSTRLKPEFRIE